MSADVKTASANNGANGSHDWPESFHWWVDAVGSFLVISKKQLRIGQAGEPLNDIAILGDLARHHADLLVSSLGVVLIAHAPTKVNGIAGDSFLLKDGDRISMRSVELLYRRPISSMSTSRLTITSRHRLPMTMDGIILLGETCRMGPDPDAVINAPWPSSVHLNWYQGRWWARGPEDLMIDGRTTGGCGPLTPNSRVEGSGWSFRWEPVQRKGRGGE